MGFKPKERLKKSYCVRHSQFIYPDETVIEGSTTAFACLLDRMIANDVVVCVRMCLSADSLGYLPHHPAGHLLPTLCCASSTARRG